MGCPLTSSHTWNRLEKVKIRADLFLPGKKIQRIAILGIGNELNGDDAAGVLVARALLNWTRENEPKTGLFSPVWYIVEAGLAPEAFTGPLRRFQPDLVFLVDAAELGEPPGTVACFDWVQAEGMSASTHTLPPTVLAQYLIDQLGCGVVLIGIQPKSLDFDEGMSVEVQRAVDEVVTEFQVFFAEENF